MVKKVTTAQRRKWRIRSSIKKSAHGRPRLSVHRTGMHIYAQVIDDTKGITLASASTIDKSLKTKLKGKTANVNAATEVGKLVAANATKAGVKEVIFDRGGNKYHGRIKALADAAREAGLSF